MPPDILPPPQGLKQFNTEIQFLLKPKNPHARSLLAFIRRTLRQYELDGTFTEIDIFIQAYLRGVNYVTESGNTIRRPKAWMRTTALNVIREINRSNQRYQLQAYDDFELGKLSTASLQLEGLSIDDEVIEINLATVSAAFRELSLKERHIIQLRVIEGLSWKEVGQRLVALGEKKQSDVSLRKRGQRALEELRRLYHQKRSQSCK